MNALYNRIQERLNEGNKVYRKERTEKKEKGIINHHRVIIIIAPWAAIGSVIDKI
jgi:hypothetical protein